MKGSGTGKILIVGVAAAVLYMKFGPMGVIFAGVLLMMLG